MVPSRTCDDDAFITTFKYMEDKNIFVKFYTKHFCKRLLDKQSTSDKTESSFISRLAECCGYEYTSRLAKMVQDTQVSKDLSSGYKDQQLESSRRKKNIELGIQVLSTGTWRSNNNPIATGMDTKTTQMVLGLNV
ncbi:Protein CBG27741 [Caenorhabditis briggsae]|uniref:Protein CBG27741 n=1 Tax=Caenorhabditis briggsae TaxID=6238 RepID=B6IJ39_CAEBR|nr:Protein CBG27741 [Caenorhabditis briggsae]CAS00019.1 Protein CBG27741 [Caenorhabditis briggsae]